MTFVNSIFNLKSKFKADILRSYSFEKWPNAQYIAFKLTHHNILFSICTVHPKEQNLEITMSSLEYDQSNLNELFSYSLPYFDLQSNIIPPPVFTINRSTGIMYYPAKQNNTIEIMRHDFILNQSQSVFQFNKLPYIAQIYANEHFLCLVDPFHHCVKAINYEYKLFNNLQNFEGFEAPIWILEFNNCIYIGFFQGTFQRKHPKYTTGKILSDASILKINQNQYTSVYPDFDNCPEKLIKKAYYRPDDFIFAQTNNYLIKFDLDWKLIYQLNLPDLFNKIFFKDSKQIIRGVFNSDIHENKLLIIESKFYKKGIILEV